MIHPCIFCGKPYSPGHTCPAETPSWKKHVITFGKYAGKTVFMVYVNDFAYIEWAVKNTTNAPETDLAMFADAVKHKDRVDPYARDHSRE